MANARISGPAVTSRVRTFEDVDEMSDHLAGWNLEFIQLAAGQVAGSHGMARIGPMLLQGGQTLVPLIQRGAAPPLATFSVLADPRIRVVSRGRDHGGDHVFINRPGDEIHWRTEPGFSVRTLSVDEGLLRQTATEMGLERGVDLALRAQTVRPSPDALATLQQALFERPANRLTCSDEPTRPTGASTTESSLLRLLARALASRDGSAESERLRHLDRVMLEVEAVLNQHPHRAFTREELSAAVGVSDRTIRRAAQAWCGTSPLSLAKILRLHAARRDLRRATARSTRVIDVAIRFGFTHMSRFAGEYSALFGERPSDTLRSDSNLGQSAGRLSG